MSRRKEEFDRCMEDARRRIFGSHTFLTLKVPAEARKDAEDYFKLWIDWFIGECGGSYLRAIEPRDDGAVFFHLIFGAPVSQKTLDAWRWYWRDYTGGTSWEKNTDRGVEGLLGYFFFKRHFDIDFDDEYTVKWEDE